MGPVTPFIPMIISGAGALGGSLFAKKTGMGGPTDIEKGLMTQGAGTAGQLGQLGGQAASFGTNTLGKSAGYYQRLLHGDRNMLTQTLQPEIRGITDLSRGAERNLSRSGVRGASRDLATAEIGRQKAGQIGGLFAAARPMAANALTQIGQNSQAQGFGALGNAGSIYGGLLNPAGQQRRDQTAEQGAFGETVGGLAADFAKIYSAGKNKK
jgi:hypothetical protein